MTQSVAIIYIEESRHRFILSTPHAMINPYIYTIL